MTKNYFLNGYTERVNKDTGELQGLVKTLVPPNMIPRNIIVPPGQFPMTDEQIKAKMNNGEVTWVRFEDFDILKAWNNFESPNNPGFTFCAAKAVIVNAAPAASAVKA